MYMILGLQFSTSLKNQTRTALFVAVTYKFILYSSYTIAIGWVVIKRYIYNTVNKNGVIHKTAKFHVLFVLKLD